MTHASHGTSSPDRELDLVLFGATGFTGRLATIDDALGDLPLLTADVADDVSLKDLANRARVVITTVGPYLIYGEPLLAACAQAGTDYVDLAGEPEFVDRMYLAHHSI